MNQAMLRGALAGVAKRTTRTSLACSLLEG
jgi:hypothetical protein